MNDLSQRLKETIRDVPDFPKPGILFKDITPVLADPKLSLRVSEAFYSYWKGKGIAALVGIESRGFIYGLQLAQQLGVPFIPVRKAGKLPYKTVRHAYDLEYGSAEIEMHEDAIRSGDQVLIHDDLLATGGTAKAAAQLIQKMNGKVLGYSFLIELAFLNGRKKLKEQDVEIQSLVTF
ncbi:MAG: adenine phosphoribosyltransferase [Cyclobacteriaceae bacterium]|nr:adenine phosphoribosyltransferase [Cyclobacteriaceae bacterium SS2]